MSVQAIGFKSPLIPVESSSKEKSSDNGVDEAISPKPLLPLESSSSEGSSSYDSSDESSASSMDPFVQWRLGQKSIFRLSDADIYAEAKLQLDQGFYQNALERLSSHSNPQTVLPEFLEAVIGDYITHDAHLDLPKEVEKEQIDSIIQSCVPALEGESALFPLVLEVGLLFVKEPSEELLKKIDLNLFSFFKEIEIDDYRLRSTVLSESAKLLSSRGYHFEAVWLLWMMNPFGDKHPYWNRLFCRKRDEAAVTVVTNLAKAGAIAPAVRLAHYIKDEAMREKAMAAPASQLEKRGYPSLSRLIIEKEVKS